MSTAGHFSHEAALYSGLEGFLETTIPFIGEALNADEQVLVAVSREKIGHLRTALDGDAKRVRFVDMAEIGSNPARIIPAWIEFVCARGDEENRVWGIGEPIGPDRNGETLIECQLHESLLNVAFAGTPHFNLLCPYDVAALDPTVIEEAHRSHPMIRDGGVRRASDACRDLAQSAAPCDLPLPPPPRSARQMRFDHHDALPAVRRYTERRACAAGVERDRIGDVVLAINELAANSLVHGGGSGVLRIWAKDTAVVFEVTDGGEFNEPLAGRRPPSPGKSGGWGLWLANQLCDLVQVRSYGDGTVVRLHVGRTDQRR